MFVVRQQSVVVTLDETKHRWVTMITPVKLNTCKTFGEAYQLVYSTFTENEVSSHYGVISQGGKFLKVIRIGELDGFKKPGIVDQ